MTLAGFAAALLASNGGRECIPAAAVQTMYGIARWESRLDPLAIHDNTDLRSYHPATKLQAVQIARDLVARGHDIDAGASQVNLRNWHWTGLTIETAFDWCPNIRAGTSVLFAKYNGNPPEARRVAYAAGVLRNLEGITPEVSAQVQAPAAPPPAPDPMQKPSRTGVLMTFAVPNGNRRFP